MRVLPILLFIVLIELSALSSETNTTKENNQTKIIIDLDKEKSKNSRGKIDDIIYGMLYIGDNNDEVTFVGKMLTDASDIVIDIKDSIGKIKETIKGTLTIKTDKLENEDMVVIKKGYKVLMKKEVAKKHD